MTANVSPPASAALIRQFRERHKLTLEATANLLDTTKQRIFQYENGSTVPFERIRDWLTSSGYPVLETEIRELARALWLAQLETELGGLQSRVDDFKATLTTE